MSQEETYPVEPVNDKEEIRNARLNYTETSEKLLGDNIDAEI